MEEIKKVEEEIKYIKDTFEKKLQSKLKLTRVSAPLFVYADTGLNDHLNGYERPVCFDILHNERQVEIVQSLAKWKRMALARYHFKPYEGLYTDMNAIRRDEVLDNLHSIYVDQWDWEMIILKKDRNKRFLRKIVRKIYQAILAIAQKMEERYGYHYDLPAEITFITSNELLALYPDKNSKERENLFVREHKAVFLEEIGDKLTNGLPHDGRASDYDDWHLNGDILLWFTPLELAFEISSMGIRVDEKALIKQLKDKNEMDKLKTPYANAIINKELPYTIGGGIGQSRLCMYLMQRRHIGEVQASVWPDEMLESLAQEDIFLL